ncbi:hypothetical protein LSH36_3143g00000 [Paralvinella palmiformis]|uniref:Uncharacterized protein n=1 Tax=Paralvinella palmiformis TaxID=53620 RepID=A0AAD9IPK4_9ANNE|nr:hypothetical protein LSH36_3143g00000 [Paralvinella palmiformis]
MKEGHYSLRQCSEADNQAGSRRRRLMQAMKYLDHTYSTLRRILLTAIPSDVIQSMDRIKSLIPCAIAQSQALERIAEMSRYAPRYCLRVLPVNFIQESHIRYTCGQSAD